MEKVKRKFPHIFAVLFLMMALALIATWIVPSGTYERVVLEGTTRSIVDPASFQYIDKDYLTPFRLFTAVTEGMNGAALVAFSILIIGGSWQVIHKTGAISNGINSIAGRLKGKEVWIFPLLMAVFAAIAAIIGGAELMIVYLPAIMPLALALGFDTMTATGCVIVGGYTAFAVSVTNPFTVGIGDQIAGLEMYSGAWYRIILEVVFFIVGAAYVMRYAKKVRKNPQSSLVYEESREFAKSVDEEPAGAAAAAGSKSQLIGIVLVALLLIMVFGVVKWGWYLQEINGIFLFAAFLSAIIGRLSLDEVCEALTAGAKSVVVAAIVCGLSRGIMSILEAGMIIDVIIHGLAGIVGAMPKTIAVIGIFIAQTLFNFLVNSGSGQFLITMPILSPLGDIAGLSQQVIILASQMGDGFTNMLFPTSGVLMACLGFAKIPFGKWLRFILPYMGIVTVMSCAALIIAQSINYV